LTFRHHRDIDCRAAVTENMKAPRRRSPRPPISVQRNSGLTVIHLRGRIDESDTPLLAKTLITELTRRRLKLLTIHLDTTAVLHPNARAILISAERTARHHGLGFGVVCGPHISGSIQDLDNPPTDKDADHSAGD
jgi:hypothetical protein